MKIRPFCPFCVITAIFLLTSRKWCYSFPIYSFCDLLIYLFIHLLIYFSQFLNQELAISFLKLLYIFYQGRNITYLLT